VNDRNTKGFLLAGENGYCLIGRIGGHAFPVGTRKAFVSDATGSLFLSMNDVSGVFWDNRGDITATITVSPAGNARE
jgi:hypothetical protein